MSSESQASSPVENEKNKPAGDMTAEVFVFPTTVAQKRFWMLDQLKPGNPIFNIPLAARLTGRLQFDMLEKAVNLLIERHEILRTSFSVLDGEVMQLIHPAQTIKLDRYDVSNFPQDERETQVTRLTLQEGERSFSLSNGLLLRGGVIKVSDEEHVIMLTMHHICADGWSNGVLIRELAETYTHLLGAGPALPELPLQYADFAQWQQEWLNSPMAEEQRKYWLECLHGAMPVLNQPTDRPRSASSRNPGTIHTLLLPKPLTEGLKMFCQREDMTTFMLFFAAYAILLYRYTGNTDLIVGTPTANRGQTELEGLIGLFSNPLVLRTDLSGKPTFREFLERVRILSLDAFAHQSYPFELLAESVKIDQTRAGGQWIQAYFIYQKAFMVPQQMPQLTLTPMRSVSPGATFEWTLGVLERTEGTRLQLEYNTDLFDEATIDRFLHHFQHLLESIPAGLDQKIDELTILTPIEEKNLLIDRNQSRVEYPVNRCVHEIFDAQAQKTPGAIALEDGARSITYGELSRQAGLLAQKLLSVEIGQDKHVAMVIDRWSIESIMGILAIMKAGACCVLIDANRPPEQLSGCIANKALRVGLIHEELKQRVAIEGLHWLDFRTEGFAEFKTPDLVSMDQPACIRFKPKETGPDADVILSHRALLNGTFANVKEIAIREEDRIGSGFSGLMDMEDILAALTSGASIILRPHDHLIGRNLFGWICDARITVLAMSNMKWQQIAHALSSDTPFNTGNLRCVVTHGRQLAKAPWIFWQNHLNADVNWLHRYTVCEYAGPAAWFRPLDTSQQNMNCEWRAGIDHASANTHVYLLDKNLQPVPAGIMGRLFIGGDGLALSGSSGLEDADRFVRVKFSGSMETRLFKTDDFGRFLPNNQIEFVAQVDELTKTNGWRLELRELQLVLMEHPDVWDSKLAITDPAGLTAYIVSKNPSPPRAADIILYCRQRLPSYMTPAAVVVLDDFPLSADGEIDLQALPIPDKESSALHTEYIPPRTDTERKLSEIWAELLHLERVGIHDSFFALGGHSLLAARLFFRIELEFNRKLPLAVLISRPTIEQLAALLESRSDSSGWPSLIPIQKQVNEPAFFCVHGAGGNILIYRELAKHLGSSVAFYGLQSQGLDRQTPCLTRIEDMAARYVNEIQSVQPVGPYYIGGYCMGGQIAYEMAKIIRQQGHEVALVALLDSYNTQVIWEKKTFLRHLSIWKQKLTFHADNLARLNFNETLGYINEKLRMAGELIRGKFVAALAMFRNKVIEGGGDSTVEAYIQEINHQALRDYRPAPFEVKVTLFKPERNYDTYSDPNMGWSGFALGGIEIVELPVNPHAMLIEPFVKSLAAELGKRIAPGRNANPQQPS